MYFLGCNFPYDTIYIGLAICIRHASPTRNWVADFIRTLIKKGGRKTSSLCFARVGYMCWSLFVSGFDVGVESVGGWIYRPWSPPGQWNHAFTSNSSWMFVITDLTLEEQQLLESIRERKQKLIKEIQVGL